jgi:uncharacterized Fe-S cluster-containing radical SAM superfamily protein
MSKLSYYWEMYRKINILRSAPKIWNYLKYRASKRKTRMSIKRYTPQIASVWVTRRCNLHCGYCAAGKILYKDKKKWLKSEATLEKIKRIFANPLFNRCLLVDLQGGEPLLVKDFDKIVSYLVTNGHIVNTSTNGLLLGDRILDLKRAGISRINVSFYEANKSILKRDLKKINKIFPVHASIVLMRSKLEKKPDEILETARFIRKAGCRSLRFWIYRPMGTNPNPKEVINDTLPAYLRFRERLDRNLPGFCLWPAAIRTGKVKKLCAQLWQRVGCDMLGNMAICCGVETTLTGPKSNLFTNHPDVVYNHPTLVAMRQKLLDPESEPPTVCKTCNLLGEPGW